jgi:hypothetical protein
VRPARILLAVIALAATGLSVGACSSAAPPHSPSTNSSQPSLPRLDPSGPQLGINVLWYYDGTDSEQQIAQKSRELFSYIRSLGANSVAISFPFYTANWKSNRIYAAVPTPSPAQLGIVIDVATYYGMRTTLRPLMDQTDLSPKWRGTISPESPAAWFASYSAFLRPYLIMAQRTGVAEFDVGVELDSLATSSEWADLIAQARTYFHGEIGYDTNWSVATEGIMGPSSVNALGIDMYRPVSLPSSASVSQLDNAWTTWLRSLPGVNLRDVAITEVGIPAQNGAFQHPFSTGSASSPISPVIQQKWFGAACDAMRQLHMSGIYFWNIALSLPPGTFNPATAPPMSFVGRGSSAIKACFQEIEGL